jgi:galactokinase
MERVDLFAEALEKQDAKSAGHYLRASHESLRDDYEVSCAELDALVDSAYEFGSERGLIGSRMTGGGFGGSTISLVEQDSAALLQEYLRKNYSEKFGRELNCFITRLVDGASVGPVQPPLVTL